MKISGRYAPGLQAGIAGILLLIGINLFTIPGSLRKASERDELRSEAELEQVKAETTKKISDTYSKNSVVNFGQLIISNYTLSNTPPKLDWKRTVEPTRKTLIYDKNRQCVGYANQGKFYFTKYYQGVCNAS
jgi:hypothetical protein